MFEAKAGPYTHRNEGLRVPDAPPHPAWRHRLTQPLHPTSSLPQTQRLGPVFFSTLLLHIAPKVAQSPPWQAGWLRASVSRGGRWLPDAKLQVCEDITSTSTHCGSAPGLLRATAAVSRTKAVLPGAGWTTDGPFSAPAAPRHRSHLAEGAGCWLWYSAISVSR